MGMARREWLEQGIPPSVAMHRRTTRRRSAYYCWIDVSALLAVFLVIFISLAIAPENLCSRGAVVDLFASGHSRLTPHAIREDALQVVVTRDGRLFLGTHEVVPKELPHQLREGVRAGAENRVYLMVDSRAKYGDVKPALNEIRLSGVNYVSFLTSPVRSQQAGSQSIATGPSE
jgi:biopolymer transport protein ExbD